MLKVLIFLNIFLCQFSDSDLRSVYLEIQSPFCPGRALSDCPTEKAQKLRDEIRLSLEAGRSKDEVVEDIIARYGEEYRAKPKASGFGILAWLMPFAFILFVASLFFKKVKVKVPEQLEDK
jgi:cytochrome c-type biogenesis protein CcmH